jgi:hypothetical protein
VRRTVSASTERDPGCPYPADPDERIGQSVVDAVDGMADTGADSDDTAPLDV